MSIGCPKITTVSRKEHEGEEEKSWTKRKEKKGKRPQYTNQDSLLCIKLESNNLLYNKLGHWVSGLLISSNKCMMVQVLFSYRGSPPYAFFGTWKKPCYMKLVLVGLYCGPLLMLIPTLTRT